MLVFLQLILTYSPILLLPPRQDCCCWMLPLQTTTACESDSVLCHKNNGRWVVLSQCTLPVVCSTYPRIPRHICRSMHFYFLLLFPSFPLPLTPTLFLSARIHLSSISFCTLFSGNNTYSLLVLDSRIPALQAGVIQHPLLPLSSPMAMSHYYQMQRPTARRRHLAECVIVPLKTSWRDIPISITHVACGLHKIHALSCMLTAGARVLILLLRFSQLDSSTSSDGIPLWRPTEEKQKGWRYGGTKQSSRSIKHSDPP